MKTKEIDWQVIRDLHNKGQALACERWGQFPIEEVKEIAIAMNNDFSIPDDVFAWTLGYLESVMAEDDFVAFCQNSLLTA